MDIVSCGMQISSVMISNGHVHQLTLNVHCLRYSN